MANFVSPFENGVAEGVASDPHDTTVYDKFTAVLSMETHKNKI